VAEFDSTVAGFIIAWHAADEAQIAELAVDPARRRKGTGRALINKACEDARAGGLKRVTLEVRAGNAAARALYLSEGFVVTATRPKFYDGNEDAVLMEKELR
jgi:ribosomal-protein-alanine N-acetyltransferase